MAAFLAWLVPGLGHFYQGRLAKAALFFIIILGTFVYGLYLGGSRQLGWGRAVYASWRPDDRRLHYFCQVCVGVPALPALVQANRVRNNKPPLLGGFMAPPALVGGDPARPSLDMLNKELHRYFELGSLYTMVAGLLNVLAIYDAWSGPVFAEPPKRRKEEDQPEDQDRKDRSDQDD